MCVCGHFGVYDDISSPPFETQGYRAECERTLVLINLSSTGWYVSHNGTPDKIRK